MKLSVENLTVCYRRGDQAVRPIEGFDLAVEGGQVVLLHGPSGCGKTSLLSAIAGLLTPESGSIYLDGGDVVTMTRQALLQHRRDRIGMVFQSFNLVASLTAEENVGVPLRLAGMKPRDARLRAGELLDRFGMGHRRSHRPGSLSGGQRQRVAIARAVALDPPVILADEPTAHLDREQVQAVRTTFQSLADSGRIVIISTHDDRLNEVAHRVVSLGQAHSTATTVDSLL